MQLHPLFSEIRHLSFPVFQGRSFINIVTICIHFYNRVANKVKLFLSNLIAMNQLL